MGSKLKGDRKPIGLKDNSSPNKNRAKTREKSVLRFGNYTWHTYSNVHFHVVNRMTDIRAFATGNLEPQ